MINISNITLKYGDKTVLSDFSYTFLDSGLYVIKGQSGSGKSTLLNAIAGFHKPAIGTITYDFDISNIRDSISLIFQDNNLIENLTLIENIKILTSLSSENITDEKITEVLSYLGILKYRDVKVSDISGGERQRVSISISLLLNKKVIIADEPLSSLDDNNSNKIMDLLKEISKNKLVILTSHNSFIVNKYADYIIDLKSLDSTQTEIATKTLYPAKITGKKLKLKEIFRIYKSVIKEKFLLKFFLSLILIIATSLLVFCLSISLYSKNDIYLKTMEDNNISITSILGLKNNEFDSTLNGKRIFTKKIEFPSFKDYNDDAVYMYSYNYPIEYVIFDNSLNDNEIVITDYVAYLLKEGLDNKELNGLNNLSNAVNCYITFYTDQSDDLGNQIEKKVKIKRVDKTDFTTVYQQRQSNWDVTEDTTIVYNYMIINEKSYYEIFGKTDYPNSLSLHYNDKLITFEYDGSLLANNITISTSFSNYLKENGLNSNLNDNINLSLNDTIRSLSKDFVITNISDDIEETDDEYIINVSKEMLNEMNYFYSDYINEEDGYYFNNFELKDMKQLIKYSLNNDYIVNFKGSNNLYSLFNEISLFQIVCSVAIILIFVIAVIIILYSTFSTYTLAYHNFQILLVYGMKKKYELVLLLMNSFITTLISLIVGSGLGFILNNSFDNYMERTNNLKMYIPTFNYKSVIFSSIIIIVVLVLSILVAYCISLKKKVKTHIS